MQPLLRLRFLALIALLGAVPVASALELGHLVSCATWAGALLPDAAGAGSPPGATRTLDWRALLPGALQH